MSRRLAAEALGTGFLIVAVIGSGIMAERMTDIVALQLLICEIEELIRLAPEQWHLFQPNWPSDPGFSRGNA